MRDAFNRMSGAVEEQQAALRESRRTAEERLAFIEATFAGVSSGVLALDEEGRIGSLNRAAEEILGLEAERLRGRRLDALARGLRSLLDDARISDGGRLHGAVVSHRPPGRRGRRTLQVRVAKRRPAGGGAGGFVVTFDDITETLSAQRQAAWSDVARAIAHEIKNPLTPIQLSAERLERRLSRLAREEGRGEGDGTIGPGEASEEQRLVREAVATITGQVGEIRRLVDEFSDFARMPRPERRRMDLAALLGEVAELLGAQAGGHRISAETQGAAPLLGDAGQLRRAFFNLAKNGLLSLEERAEREGPGWRGSVSLVLARLEGGAYWRVSVADDGVGLPDFSSAQLAEPYVTTRTKGTGLGLAIVKRIVEEHGGRFDLRDRTGAGAEAVVLLPTRETEEADGAAGERRAGEEGADSDA